MGAEEFAEIALAGVGDPGLMAGGGEKPLPGDLSPHAFKLGLGALAQFAGGVEGQMGGAQGLLGLFLRPQPQVEHRLEMEALDVHATREASRAKLASRGDNS